MLRNSGHEATRHVPGYVLSMQEEFMGRAGGEEVRSENKGGAGPLRHLCSLLSRI